ncbi:DNA repair protein RadC [Massilia sp. W12]|uniref:RadC family protein n=1 Tax=Massilia sp. W12 TaxID=3126507 RepID=UPI0030CCAD02
MSIASWPENQRPRERLIAHGASVLSDAELLAIFLRTGIPGKDAVTLGRELLQKFGSLAHIFSAALPDFSSIAGLGDAKFAQLQAAYELSRRALSENLHNQPELNNTLLLKRYLRNELAPCTVETFVALFLDTRHRLIKREVLATGTLRQAHVHTREVVRAALSHNAAAMIIAHNHPRGSCEPSAPDLHLTNTLKSALDYVEVNLLDHIIVGEDGLYSFAEHGRL